MHDVTLVILNSLRIKCRVRRSLRIYSPRRNMNIYSRSVPLKNSNLSHNNFCNAKKCFQQNFSQYLDIQQQSKRISVKC